MKRRRPPITSLFTYATLFGSAYRLKRTATLIVEGKYNISEIAYMTGFNTLSHFSTSFKKQFGCTPSEYSKKTY